MDKKSQDMLYIESCFKNIKTHTNINTSLETIQRTLKRSFDIDVEISISNNNTNKFFGMVIYPSKSTMDMLIETILNGPQDKTNLDSTIEVWKNNKKWFIEIDSLLLYDIALNANPSEITAILLHEIGHIVFSNTVPQRVNRIIRFEMLKLNYKIRDLCKRSATNKLFKLAIIEACSNKNFKYTNVKTEIAADQFVVKNGYAVELDNFITKLIGANGNSNVNKGEGEIDKDVEIVVDWAIENIGELQMRKTKLKQSIDVQILKTPSMFVKGVLKSIKDIFIRTEGDAYKRMLREQWLLQSHDKIVNESIMQFMNNIGKVKKIDQIDIDIIEVEIDRIENGDDKIYILDLIYEKLELINMALDLIESGKSSKVSQSKSNLTIMKIQLEKMRAKVMGLKTPDKKYGVFIKYPVGFEG